MKELIVKYKSFISYVFFGVCTTVINILVYSVFARVLGFSLVSSNVIAWIMAVAFAYITNRLWVFESPNFGITEVIKEIFSFVICRLATGAIDLIFMYITVNFFCFDDVIMKVIANIIVIVCNYVASKLIIFTKKSGE